MNGEIKMSDKVMVDLIKDSPVVQALLLVQAEDIKKFIGCCVDKDNIVIIELLEEYDKRFLGGIR